MAKKLRLQSFLPYRCAQVAEKISVSLSRIYVDEFGVNVAQWRILATLAEFGELQAKQVGERTNMDKVRVSRAVASLLKRNLLLRRNLASDSRASLLKLSAKGQTLYNEIVPRALYWEQSLVETLSTDEHATLFNMLDKLENRLLDMDSGND